MNTNVFNESRNVLAYQVIQDSTGVHDVGMMPEMPDLDRDVLDACVVDRARRLERVMRDNAAVEASLAAIEVAARGTQNTMPLFVEAVGHGATVGEICRVLRGVWGEYRESLVI